MTAVPDMIWEEPPVAVNRPWRAAFVAGLQRRPGRWSRVVVDGRDVWPSSSAQALKRRGCEVRYKLVSTEPNRFHVWARWPKAQP